MLPELRLEVRDVHHERSLELIQRFSKLAQEWRENPGDRQERSPHRAEPPVRSGDPCGKRDHFVRGVGGCGRDVPSATVATLHGTEAGERFGEVADVCVRVRGVGIAKQVGGFVRHDCREDRATDRTILYAGTEKIGRPRHRNRRLVAPAWVCLASNRRSLRLSAPRLATNTGAVSRDARPAVPEVAGAHS